MYFLGILSYIAIEPFPETEAVALRAYDASVKSKYVLYTFHENKTEPTKLPYFCEGCTVSCELCLELHLILGKKKKIPVFIVELRDKYTKN